MNPLHPDGQELKEELTLLQSKVETLQQLIGELIFKNQQLRDELQTSGKKPVFGLR